MPPTPAYRDRHKCEPANQASFAEQRNPSGRPRRKRWERAEEIALQEAYRPVTVRDGEKITRIPAIQAVHRSQIALAAKGNGPAQRAVLRIIQKIERERFDLDMELLKTAIEYQMNAARDLSARPSFLLGEIEQAVGGIGIERSNLAMVRPAEICSPANKFKPGRNPAGRIDGCVALPGDLDGLGPFLAVAALAVSLPVPDPPLDRPLGEAQALADGGPFVERQALDYF
jgi:Family of unknown function (DUF5681)